MFACVCGLFVFFFNVLGNSKCFSCDSSGGSKGLLFILDVSEQGKC